MPGGTTRRRRSTHGVPRTASTTAAAVVASAGAERRTSMLRRRALRAGRRSHCVHSVLRMPRRRRSAESRDPDGRWRTTTSSTQHIHQPAAARSSASSSSSPLNHMRRSNPPTCLKAAVRNMVTPASTPRSGLPGSHAGPGTGDSRSSGVSGSSSSPGSTRHRPVTLATDWWASRTSAARSSEPGSQHTSSSQKAT
nr:hypothetical protein [Glycomyces arizonensis]